MQKAISGVGVFGSGLLLSIVNFPQQARPGQVEETVLLNLVFVFLPTLAVLFLLAVIFMSAYSIDRNTHEENLRRLAEVQSSSSASAAQRGETPDEGSIPERLRVGR
jgi:Na+/melibiose symporter-like transporter